MKKIVVILLLVLPFVLIYSISFTGRILAQYTHIYVDRIAIVDEVGEEYETDTILKIAKGETLSLNVRVYPELATNKEFTVSNSDKAVCSVNEETNEVTGLEYGTSRIVLTSKDRPVSFAFYVTVSDNDIQSINVSKTDVTVSVGKKETVTTEILPITTLQENRNLVWSSADESVATVNANGVITGVSAGTTTVTVRSDYKENVFTVINVTVTQEVTKPVYFDVPAGTYVVREGTLDLNAITKITAEGYTDLRYEVTSGKTYADVSRLNEGVVTFLSARIYKVKVSVVLDGQTYEDELTVFFNPAS